MKLYIRYLKYLFSCLRYWNDPILGDFYKPCSFKMYKFYMDAAFSIVRKIARATSVDNDHRWANIDKQIKEEK